MVCLLGIAFLAAGILVSVPFFAQWQAYIDSASWERVDATIESVALVSHRVRNGVAYALQCSYSYPYRGRAYTGHRVGLESENASYAMHQLRQQVLQEHLDKQQVFHAWVNPALPAESLLFRELTDDLYWPPVKCLVLSVIGAIVLFVGLRKIMAAQRRERRLRRYPDRPWRVAGSWDDFMIHAHNLKTVIACWGIGIFLALFFSPAFIWWPLEKKLPFHVWFVFLVPTMFALFALWLIGKAVYLTLQYLKYGDPVLALSQLPVVPGTQFRATLLVKRHLVTEHGIRLTFKCVETTVTGSGKGQSTDSKDLHSATKIVTKDMVRPAGEGSAVPVAFDVPTGLPDREPEDNPSYEWTLEVKAQTPGIDFAAEFDLPVYTVKDQALVEKRPTGNPGLYFA